MSKKALTIYPYSLEMFSFVKKYLSCEREYELPYVCTFPGTGLVGKLCTGSEDKNETDLEILEDLDSVLEKTDLILVPHTELALDNSDYLFEKIVDLLKLGKKVICNISFGEKKDKILLGREFLDLFSFGEMAHWKSVYDNLGSRMYTSRIPIILTGEIFPYKSEISNSFCISDYFGEEYKVVNIGGCQFSNLFGQFEMPSFLFDSDILEDEKVLKFNHFVRDVIEKENPDLLIINLPDAPVKYKQNLNLNGYGILSYIISKAVMADGIILTIPCELLDKGIINKLQNKIRCLYGIPLICVDVSNIQCFENVSVHTIRLSENYFRNMFFERYFKDCECEIVSTVIDKSAMGKCVRKYFEEESNGDL